MFRTADNKNLPFASTKQIQEIDRIATEETGPNLYQMMENAGRNTALMAMEKLEDKKDRKVIVMAGKGGNGGGGICAGRHLANHGFNVTVCLPEPNQLKDVTRYQLEILRCTDASILIQQLPTESEKHGLIIDAVLGYSLKSAPHGFASDCIKWIMNKNQSPVLSLDIPSGIDADNGSHPGVYVMPDYTLTLALPKHGLSHCDCGELFLGDIGIPPKVYVKAGISVDTVFNGNFIVKLKIV